MPKTRFKSQFKELYMKNLERIEEARDPLYEARLRGMITEVFDIQKKYIDELENRMRHLEEANASLRGKLRRVKHA